jgi:2-isopropylmalate synthase
MLDEFGLDYVEGGYPGANPTDSAFFEREAHVAKRTFVAFGMTKRAAFPSPTIPGSPLNDAAKAMRSACRQKLGLPCPCRARLHQ